MLYRLILLATLAAGVMTLAAMFTGYRMPVCVQAIWLVYALASAGREYAREWRTVPGPHGPRKTER